MALERFRGRMPLLVFVLLALVCMGLVGFACACLDDQAALALERAVQAPALPALIELWSLLALSTFAATLHVGRLAPGRGRASPALLQRFLF